MVRPPPQRSRLSSLALLGAALAACGAPVVAVNISVSTKACDGATGAGGDPGRNPVAGVDTLRFKITGDKFPALTQDAPFATGGLSVPNLPLGTNRRISVEARRGNTLWARADSGLFDVADGRDLDVALVLRVVDSFTLAGRPGGGACSRMTAPRVGHAMTLLPDGRVLITGGFSLDASSQLHYQKDAEIYDPATGVFAPAASPAYRRIGHAALAVSSLTGTGILVGGGEGPSDANGSPTPVRPYELFSSGTWQILQPGTTSPSREHHAAVVDLKKGFAVFAGGLTGPDTPPLPSALDVVSYFDFDKGVMIDVAEPLAQKLFDAAIVARSNAAPGGQQLGGFVLLGGRTASGAATNQISGMVFSESFHDYKRDRLWEAPALSALPTPRVRHSAVRLIDDSIAVIGGLTAANTSGDYANATDAVTQVLPSASSIVELTGSGRGLSQARGDGCAALLEGGAVLYAGGAWKDGGGKSRSAAAVDVVSLTSNGADPAVRGLQGPSIGGTSTTWGLQTARHRAACVRLRDGSVLVTGGFQYGADGASLSTLDSAEIYTPPGAP